MRDTPKINMLLDSGAFTAWRKNRPLTVKEYIRFIKQHKDHCPNYVNLDVIPGAPGKAKSTRDIELSAKGSWDNYQAMLDADLTPMPVYHMGENLRWLEKMVDSPAVMIGLGGVARAPEEVRRPWLDSVFRYLCGNKGYPRHQIHGFGITSIETIHRYPWSSVDSVSWRLYAAYGWAIIPHPDPNGGFDFTKTPMSVYLSTGNDKGQIHRSADGKAHASIRTMGKRNKDYIESYLESQGYKLKDVMSSDVWRTRVTINFFKKTMEAYRYTPFIIKPNIFQSGKVSDFACYTVPSNPRPTMYFGISPSLGLLKCLLSEDVKDMLLSYEYFQNPKKPPLDIKRFVMTGRVGTIKRIKLEE